MTHAALFDPIRIGKKEIKNRLAFAPMATGTADYNGGVTDQTICHYAARAKGGAGLLVIEHTMSNYKYGLPGSGLLGIHQDRNMPGWYDLAAAIHAFDAAAVVQLSLGPGRQVALGVEPVGPSAVPFTIREENCPRGLKSYAGFKSEVPRKLPIAEIKELEDIYVAAVSRLKQCGFDGIEIHGAHGYLLGTFLSPLVNRRRDRYGGSFEKRLTLALNLVRRSREAAGDDFILGFRISGDEHLPGGVSLEDTLKIAAVLEEAGVDYIHPSSGMMEALKYMFPDREGAILPEAEAIKKVVGIPVICPNLHDPRKAAQAVKTGKVDMVSLGRSLLADPEWPNKVKKGRVKDIQRCVLCNSCLVTLFQWLHTRCKVNPNLGMERFMPEYFPPPAKKRGRGRRT
jgi:2,4-dienoyl-CoA reductase-like NADH-dependent reductase (Old Yellow Enzyme family)